MNREGAHKRVGGGQRERRWTLGTSGTGGGRGQIRRKKKLVWKPERP